MVVKSINWRLGATQYSGPFLQHHQVAQIKESQRNKSTGSMRGQW
ncbi:hypothetical protein Hanom_Chr14g01317081 [Helianthus anomalus]